MFVFKRFQELDNVRMFQPGNKPKEIVSYPLEEGFNSFL
jgi:hypothetical protein